MKNHHTFTSSRISFLVQPSIRISVAAYELNSGRQKEEPFQTKKKKKTREEPDLSHPGEFYRTQPREASSYIKPPRDRTSRFSTALHHFYARHISGRPNGPNDVSLTAEIRQKPQPKVLSRRSHKAIVQWSCRWSCFKRFF